MEKMIDWNEEINDWVIKTPGIKEVKGNSKRP